MFTHASSVRSIYYFSGGPSLLFCCLLIFFFSSVFDVLVLCLFFYVLFVCYLLLGVYYALFRVSLRSLFHSRLLWCFVPWQPRRKKPNKRASTTAHSVEEVTREAFRRSDGKCWSCWPRLRENSKLAKDERRTHYCCKACDSDRKCEQCGGFNTQRKVKWCKECNSRISLWCTSCNAAGLLKGQLCKRHAQSSSVSGRDAQSSSVSGHSFCMNGCVKEKTWKRVPAWYAGYCYKCSPKHLK